MVNRKETQFKLKNKISSTCPPSASERDKVHNYIEQNTHGLYHQTAQSSDLCPSCFQRIPGDFLYCDIGGNFFPKEEETSLSNTHIHLHKFNLQRVSLVWLSQDI